MSVRELIERERGALEALPKECAGNRPRLLACLERAVAGLKAIYEMHICEDPDDEAERVLANLDLIAAGGAEGGGDG